MLKMKYEKMFWEPLDNWKVEHLYNVYVRLLWKQTEMYTWYPN